MAADGLGTLALGRPASARHRQRLPWRARGRGHLLGYTLLAPAFILVFGLIVYPVLYDVALSLTDADGFSGPGSFVGLDNFGRVLGGREFRTAAWNSLLYAAVSASLRLLLGVGMALLLWRLRRGRALVFLALFVPWAFPAALSGFAFYWLMSPPFHTFYTLRLLELRWAVADLLGQDLWHVGAIVLHDVWRSSAFLAIFLLAGLNTLPSEQLEYAQIECRSGWQRLWHVILPMTRKFVVLGLLLSLVLSFIDYTSIYLQTGGRITWPLVGTLAYKVSFFDGDTALGATITLAQLPAWFAVLWVGFRLFEGDRRKHTVRETDLAPLATAVLRRSTPGTSGPRPSSSFATSSLPSSALTSSSRPASTLPSGLLPPDPPPPARVSVLAKRNDEASRTASREGEKASHERHADITNDQKASRERHRGITKWLSWHTWWGRAWLMIAAVLVVLYAIFPVWWILLQAVRPISEDRYGNPFWTWAPSLEGFQEALEGRHIWVWLLNTGIVVVVGVALTLVASVLAGYALGRLSIPGRRWIARLLFATYFLPQPMVLVPIYQVFLALGLDNTLASVILLNQTLTIPFATWLCFSYFDGLDSDVESHAALDGSRWNVFRHILLPMSWPVIIAAGVFAAGVMLSDFVYAGLLLLHNDVKTVAVGLGMIGISLDEFDRITGGIGLGAIPLVIACAAFAPAYVRGLSAAMVEGS